MSSRQPWEFRRTLQNVSGVAVLHFIKRFLTEDPTKGWRRTVTDSVLGDLVLDDDATFWEGSMVLDGKPVSFYITGEGEPSEEALARARSIAKDFERFKLEVLLCSQGEIERFRSHEAEILQLEIDHVVLWHGRRSDGMVSFRGPGDTDRLWRCDLENVKPVRLDYDD